MDLANVKSFIGIYSIDNLPDKISQNQCCIINLDNSYSSGTHWTTVFIGQRFAEYYDSFGLIADERIRNMMKTSGKPLIYSCSEVQPVNNNSILCGYYCCLYIILRNLGVDGLDILDLFNQNGSKVNDKIVIKELKKLLL